MGKKTLVYQGAGYRVTIHNVDKPIIQVVEVADHRLVELESCARVRGDAALLLERYARVLVQKGLRNVRQHRTA